MVSWFPVGLLHDAKRLQRQWFPGRTGFLPLPLLKACSFFQLPSDFMESHASLGSGWRWEGGWRWEKCREGSGNWICVYLQRICAVAGKWTYNLTCLTNAFKRFSSYFPQQRDQSCCLFSPTPSLSLSTYSHSSPCWYSFRIPFQLALHFLFTFRFASRLIPFSDLICNLIVIDIRVRVQKGFTSEWKREMRFLTVLDTTRRTVNWGLATVNWNPTRSTKRRRLANVIVN